MTEVFEPYRPPHLSFSQLETYERCPYAYWLRYVKGVPEPPNHYAAFGSFIHGLIEQDGKARMLGRIIPETDLLDRYAKGFPRDAFASPELADQYWQKGLAMMRHYRASTKTAEVIDVESPFQIDPSFGVPIVGYIDRIEKRDGEYWILDYKTGRPFTADDHRADQLLLYGLAFFRRYRRRPKRMVFHFLGTNDYVEMPLTQDRLDRLRDRFVRMLQGLRQGQFGFTNASPFWCEIICGYRDICPLWKGRASSHGHLQACPDGRSSA